MSRKRLAALIGAAAVFLTAVASFLTAGCHPISFSADKIGIETGHPVEDSEAIKPLELKPDTR